MARKPTPKQEKVIEGVIANRLDTKKTKTKKEILLEAGYSPQMADTPSNVLKSEIIQSEIERRTAETIKKLERVRDLTLAQIPLKVRKAPYNHLVNGVDILTKNMQLLGGKATENKAIHIQISEHVADKNMV